MLIAADPIVRTPRAVGPRPLTGATVRAPRVLVVEPDPGLRAALSTHLEGAGFVVRTAADGLEALLALDLECPDLVLLELLLPEVSGFRLLHLLKQPTRGATPPLTLVLTALSFEEARDAVREGTDDFVSKPVTLSDLPAIAARARRLVDRRLGTDERLGVPGGSSQKRAWAASDAVRRR